MKYYLHWTTVAAIMIPIGYFSGSLHISEAKKFIKGTLKKISIILNIQLGFWKYA